MRYISFHQLREEFGIGYTREHLDRLMKAKKFPQKVHLGSKKGTAVRWPEDEIIEWQEKRAEERSASSVRKAPWMKTRFVAEVRPETQLDGLLRDD